MSASASFPNSSGDDKFIENYREWVRDDVTWDLFRKAAAVAAVVAAVFSTGSAFVLHFYVKAEVAADLDQRFAEIKTSLPAEISHQIVSHNALMQELRVLAKEAISGTDAQKVILVQVLASLGQPDVRKLIAKQAFEDPEFKRIVGEIITAESVPTLLTGALLHRFEEETNPQSRASLLSQIAVFGWKNERVHDLLLELIAQPTTEETAELKETALRGFRPATTPDGARRDVELVLASLANELTGHGLREEPFPQRRTDGGFGGAPAWNVGWDDVPRCLDVFAGYVECLGSFKENAVAPLYEWLTVGEGSKSLECVQRTGAASLARIASAAAMDKLIELLHVPVPDMRDLGLAGLNGADPARLLPATKKRALRRLAPLLVHGAPPVERRRIGKLFYNGYYATTDILSGAPRVEWSGDRPPSSLLSDLVIFKPRKNHEVLRAFAHLLTPDVWKFVLDELIEQPVDDLHIHDLVIEALLASIHANPAAAADLDCPTLLERMVRRPDFLGSPGAVAAAEYALSRCDKDTAIQFVKAFGKLWASPLTDRDDADLEWRAARLLSTAGTHGGLEDPTATFGAWGRADDWRLAAVVCSAVAVTPKASFWQTRILTDKDLAFVEFCLNKSPRDTVPGRAACRSAMAALAAVRPEKRAHALEQLQLMMGNMRDKFSWDDQAGSWTGEDMWMLYAFQPAVVALAALGDAELRSQLRRSLTEALEKARSERSKSIGKMLLRRSMAAALANARDVPSMRAVVDEFELGTGEYWFEKEWAVYEQALQLLGSVLDPDGSKGRPRPIVDRHPDRMRLAKQLEAWKALLRASGSPNLPRPNAGVGGAPVRGVR